MKRDIVRHLLNDHSCLATTMVDYYGMPATGQGAWPGRAKAAMLPIEERALAVEQELVQAVQDELNGDGGKQRFVPFVVMHEFEGLLFSNCAAFAQGLGRTDLIDSLQVIRDGFPTPEHINDSPLTAPSKRVVALIPEYQKPLYGNIAAMEVGLAGIREECPHFAQWIAQLEGLAAN